MALPKIKHPTYAITIPSTKQEINIKPFTVKEEKLLLMAKSSEKTEDVISSIKQIVKNCIIEPVDVDKLATFDIEYIFIKLRAKSIGEVVELEYSEPDFEKVNFRVNLDDINVVFNPEHTNKMKLTDEVYIKLKYPTLEDMKLLDNGITEENIFEILYKCVDTIYDDESVYTDYSKEELFEFFDSLPLESISVLSHFFETMPAVEHKITLKNSEGKTKEVLLKGINNFFTF